MKHGLQALGGQQLHSFLTTTAASKPKSLTLLSFCSLYVYLLTSRFEPGDSPVSGGKVNIALELLAERPDNGQTDALVTACYYGNFGRHDTQPADKKESSIKPIEMGAHLRDVQ